MTAPQNGPQEGQQNTGGSETGNGSEGASGTQGAGNAGSGGTEGEGASALTYSDVLSALTDEQRAAIVGEVSKKNSEARSQRQRARAAEEKLASSGTGNGESGSNGQNGTQNGPQEGQQGTGQQPREGNGGQRPPEGQQQLAKARHGIAASKVEAVAAAAGFADPEDAVRLLDDITSYVDTDFSVDSEAIRGDIDELLVKKPHLKRPEAQQGGRPGRPAPDRSQGSSASGSGGKRTGVDAGRDLYRERHKSPASTS